MFTALGNVLLLATIYVFTSYAFIPTTRWRARAGGQATRRGRRTAGPCAAVDRAARHLFLTQEVWETAGDIGGITYWIVLGLFPLVGTLFLTSRLKTELEPLQTFASAADVARDVVGTPAEALVTDTDLGDVPPLDRREWRNVALVWLFSEGVQIFIVSVLVGVFFVVLGVLLVNEATTVSWANRRHLVVRARQPSARRHRRVAARRGIPHCVHRPQLHRFPPDRQDISGGVRQRDRRPAAAVARGPGRLPIGPRAWERRRGVEYHVPNVTPIAFVRSRRCLEQ